MSTDRLDKQIVFPKGSRIVESRPRQFKELNCFTSYHTLSPHKLIPGYLLYEKVFTAVNKKRELFLGLPPMNLGSFALPLAYPKPGKGILTFFPFDR